MTTLGWLAAGGILLFAVSGHPAFINLQLVGLILLARGAIGLHERTTDPMNRAACLTVIAVGAVFVTADR